MKHSEKCMCDTCKKDNPRRECWACTGIKKGMLTSVPCTVCGETTTVIATEPTIKNYHLIEVVYMSPTNTRGARVKLYSRRFQESVTLSWNYDYDNSVRQAEEYLIGKGHKVIGHCEMKNGYGIICDAIDMEFEHLTK